MIRIIASDVNDVFIRGLIFLKMQQCQFTALESYANLQVKDSYYTQVPDPLFASNEVPEKIVRASVR